MIPAGAVRSSTRLAGAVADGLLTRQLVHRLVLRRVVSVVAVESVDVDDVRASAHGRSAIVDESSPGDREHPGRKSGQSPSNRGIPVATASQTSAAKSSAARLSCERKKRKRRGCNSRKSSSTAIGSPLRAPVIAASNLEGSEGADVM